MAQTPKFHKVSRSFTKFHEVSRSLLRPLRTHQVSQSFTKFTPHPPSYPQHVLAHLPDVAAVYRKVQLDAERRRAYPPRELGLQQILLIEKLLQYLSLSLSLSLSLCTVYCVLPSLLVHIRAVLVVWWVAGVDTFHVGGGRRSGER